MKINRNNYEVFFIDFYDGKLTDMLKLEMELFLEENPDLKEEFEAFENITINTNKVSFSAKQELKRKEIVEVNGIDEENYESAFIAWHEDELNADEKALLLSFLEKNPHLDKEFQLHALLLLKKDRVVFEGKELLRKKAYIGYYWYGAAAALLLLFTAGFFLNQNKSIQSQIRSEIAYLPSATISDGIALSNISFQLIPVQRILMNTELPRPEPIENESSITMLTSIVPSANLIELNQSIYLLDWEFDETTLLAGIEAPKKRGLLAQVFRKNVEDVTENLGIENAMADQSKKMKKDPGFVKFLDGSLTVFNTITGSDTELVKNYDKEGNLRTYSLAGQTLAVSRKIPPASLSD